MNSTKKVTFSAIAIAFLGISLVLGIGGSASGATASVSAGSGQGVIIYHAHRIPSPDWAPCFALTCTEGIGPGATMYFVVYNSAGVLIAHGFADESGMQITGLNVGQAYSIYPADCDLCHNSTHNVVFDHWGDNSTVRPRAFVVQSSPISVDAYYKIVELGINASTSNSQTTQSGTSTGTTASTGGSSTSTGTAATTTSSSISSITKSQIGISTAATGIPPLGNTGKEKTILSLIQILGGEEKIVVSHGKEVFEVPLLIHIVEHSNVHGNVNAIAPQTDHIRANIKLHDEPKLTTSHHGDSEHKNQEQEDDNNDNQGDNGDN